MADDSMSSKKSKSFADEPIGEKSVEALPGIGKVLGERLAKIGFDKAYKVLGKFLLLGMDEEKFQDWLKESCEANVHQQKECFGALRDWCKANLV